MPNPLSEYGVRDIDYAMTVGMVMGEAMNEGLVGMGLVAATALNRAQNPSAYLSRSAALGDIFSAPFSANTMIDATLDGRSLSGKGRQFSPTFNSDIRGASTAGHLNFKSGLEAALMSAIDPTVSPNLGIRQDGFMRAQKATEVAVKARDMGIDLGLGIEHFAAPGFERQAGVVGDFARFGGHSLSPTGGWPAGVKAPTEKEFAARFAAAAALTGVSIPDEMVTDITAHVGRPDIMAAASIVQREAQNYLSQKLEQDVMPGLNYNDLVQPTGFGAIDVPDVTGQLGIEGQNALGFASNFGIKPDDPFGPVGLAPPIGDVEFAGYVDPIGSVPSLESFTPESYAPNPMGMPDVHYGMSEAQAISSMGLDGQRLSENVDRRYSEFGIPLDARVEAYNQNIGPYDMAAGLYGNMMGHLGVEVDPSSITTEAVPAQGDISVLGGFSPFDAAFDGGYPEPTFTRDVAAPEGIGPIGPVGMGEAFGIDVPRDFSSITDGVFSQSPNTASATSSTSAPAQGFHAGFDGGPWGATPDFSAPSLDQRNAEAFNQDAINSLAGSIARDQDRLDGNLAQQAAINNSAFNIGGFTPTDDLGLSRPAGSFGINGPNNIASAPLTGMQSSPQLATAPLSMDTFNSIHNAGMQDMMGTGLPSLAAAPFSAPSIQTVSAPPTPTAPTTASSVPMGDVSPTTSVASRPSAPQTQSLPASTAPSLPEKGPIPPSRPESFSLGPIGYGDLGLTIGGWASPVDAVANTLGFPSGTLNSPLGRTVSGAATGFGFGGLPGAVLGGVLGGTGWGQSMSNQLGDFLGTAWDHMTMGWDGYDFATHGYGLGFNERGERSHTGQRSEGATLGDGSYSERSGENPNNPQGIL